MLKQYEKLFTYLKNPEMSRDLLTRVMARIHEEQRLVSVRRRLVFFGASLAASVLAFWPALTSVESDLSNSGFSTFFSLIFSDSSSVALHWQSFALALLESLPTLSLVLFLVVALTFLASLRFVVRDARVVLKFS